MNNILDTYLDKAKNSINAKPLIGEDETREIIAKSGGGIIKSNYSKILTYKGAKKMITYSSFLGLAITALLMLFPAKHGSQLMQNSLLKSQNIISQRTGKDVKEDKVLSERKLLASIEKNLSDIREIKHSSCVSQMKYMNVYEGPIDQFVNIPVLVVRSDELANLHIIRTDSTLSFLTEETYDLKEDGYNGEALEANHYPLKGIFRQIYTAIIDSFEMNTSPLKHNYMPYNGWDMKKGSGLSTVFWENFTYPGNGGSIGYSGGGMSALIEPKIYGILNDERKNVVSTIQNYIKGNFDNPDNQYLVSVEKSKSMIIRKLLPIVLNIKVGGNLNQTILWFVPTKELIDNLPDYHRNFVLKYLNSTEFVECKDCPVEVPKPKKKTIDSVKPISGIETIDLTGDELKNLGITYENGKYVAMGQDSFDMNKVLKEYPTAEPMIKMKLREFGYDTNFRKGFMRSKIMVDLDGVKGSDGLKYGGWDLNKMCMTLPLGITTHSTSYTYNKYSGNYNEYHGSVTDFPNSAILKSLGTGNPLTDDNNGKFRPLIEKIIPVHIFVGTKYCDDSSKIKYGDINFWFYVNKEFVELLPDRYRIPIAKEMNLIDSIENTISFIPVNRDQQLQEACKALDGEKSYFGICNMTTDNISDISVFPNPMKGTTINIKFTTKETSDINIDLFDFSGKFIKNLMQMPKLGDGEHSLKLQDDVPLGDGLYLVNISDNKGNKSVIKLLVKN